MTAQNPANNNNPYDYAGRIHNEILNEVLMEYDTSEINVDNICNIVESKTKKNKELIDLQATDVNCDLLQDGVDDYTKQFVNVINSSQLSEDGKMKAKEVVNYMFEKAFSDVEISYSDLYNHYIDLERQIMNNTRLNDFDKKSLLEGCSIARYSAYFWKNTNLNKSRKSDKPQRGFWGWLAIGAADVGGGLLGGISTGISASSLAHTLTDRDKK